MAVKIRMKKMGRKHRPFFRVCAMDGRAPRDGRVIEELGTYDPMLSETDARAILNGERINYWLGVGAQPSPKVAVLIRKYGSAGSHLQQQQDAIERLGGRKSKAIDEARAAAAKIQLPKEEETAPAAEENASAAAEATEEAASTEPSAEDQSATTESTADDKASDTPAASPGSDETAESKPAESDEAKAE